ncbi:MAG: hypothetical protein LRY30_01655 [Gammaproteobacteria bacterium]|nr:hypothetical protein [Gammaproteobacteria bacterium]
MVRDILRACSLNLFSLLFALYFFDKLVMFYSAVSSEQINLLQKSVQFYLDSRHGCYASIRHSKGIQRAVLLHAGFVQLFALLRGYPETQDISSAVSVIVLFFDLPLIDSNSKMLSACLLSTFLDQQDSLSILKTNFRRYYPLPRSETEYAHFVQYYLQHPDHYSSYVLLRRRGMLIQEVQACAEGATFFQRRGQGNDITINIYKQRLCHQKTFSALSASSAVSKRIFKRN